MLIGLIAVEVFTLLCLMVRLYARWSIFKKFETDDYVMMVTMVRLNCSVVSVPDRDSHSHDVQYFWIAFTVLGEYSKSYLQCEFAA